MEKKYNDNNAKILISFINNYMGKIKYIETKDKRIIKLTNDVIIDLSDITDEDILNKIKLNILISELSGNYKTLYVTVKDNGCEINNQTDLKDPRNNVLYLILNMKDGVLDDSSKLLLSCILNTELINWDSLFLTNIEKNGIKIYKDYKVLWFNNILSKYVKDIAKEQEKIYIESTGIIKERGNRHG